MKLTQIQFADIDAVKQQWLSLHMDIVGPFRKPSGEWPETVSVYPIRKDNTVSSAFVNANIDIIVGEDAEEHYLEIQTETTEEFLDLLECFRQRRLAFQSSGLLSSDIATRTIIVGYAGYLTSEISKSLRLASIAAIWDAGLAKAYPKRTEVK